MVKCDLHHKMELIMKAIFMFKSTKKTEQVEIDLDFILPENKEMEVQLTDQLRVKNIKLQEIDLSNSFKTIRYKCEQVKKAGSIGDML